MVSYRSEKKTKKTKTFIIAKNLGFSTSRFSEGVETLSPKVTVTSLKFPVYGNHVDHNMGHIWKQGEHRLSHIWPAWNHKP